MYRFVYRAPVLPALLLWFAILPGVAGAGAFERLFAPKAELWERWTQHDDSDPRRIDHADWERFIAAYASQSEDGVRRVAYGSVSDTDRAVLDRYLERMESVQISGHTRAEQFAYWVNLYNALTVKTVLDHYPVASIRDIDISPGLFANGPWGRKALAIEGEPVSLDDIEHRILRPIWQDPRIHYAVNCAAIGCPDLQAEAFTADNTERLLMQGARDYVNHPRGVRVDEAGVTLSSIYNWFAPDFDVDGGALAHVRQYADPALRARLADVTRVDGYTYDWALNDRQ
jgi:hypothetical protein